MPLPPISNLRHNRLHYFEPVQTRAKARMITGVNIILPLFHDGAPRDGCDAAHVEEREAHHDRFRSSFDLREGVVD